MVAPALRRHVSRAHAASLARTHERIEIEINFPVWGLPQNRTRRKSAKLSQNGMREQASFSSPPGTSRKLLWGVVVVFAFASENLWKNELFPEKSTTATEQAHTDVSTAPDDRPPGSWSPFEVRPGSTYAGKPPGTWLIGS